MVDSPPPGMPRVIPYLFYTDLAAALPWLEQAFGLEQRFSMPDQDGRLIHAEMGIEEGAIMMGLANLDQRTASPQDLHAVTQNLYIYVDDVDTHYERAKANGAQILMEPEDMFWGDRSYAAADLEGHQWTFAQHVKDIAPEDMEMPEGFVG